MIGDDINDAPALKTASVGAAMRSMGSDIVVETADIALMSDDISKIPHLKRLSNAIVSTIKCRLHYLCVSIYRLLDTFLFSFDKLITENEVYSQVLLNNSHNTQFQKRLKECMIPLALQTLHISLDNKKAVYAFEFYVTGVVSMISSWMRNGRDVSIEEMRMMIKGILKDSLLAQMDMHKG